MYKAKYKLSNTKYLAEVNGKLCVVTTDKNGKIIKVVIFGKEQEQ